MFSTKQLSEDQIATIRSWAAAGANLSEIQLRMKDELKLAVTYMDTRFVVLDLGIELIEEKKEEPVAIPAAPAPSGTGVNVTMDAVPLEGSMVSGKVVFSDGENAFWTLDHHGRPGLEPETPDYQPSREDIMEFQTQLRALIEKAGL